MLRSVQAQCDLASCAVFLMKEIIPAFEITLHNRQPLTQQAAVKFGTVLNAAPLKEKKPFNQMQIYAIMSPLLLSGP